MNKAEAVLMSGIGIATVTLGTYLTSGVGPAAIVGGILLLCVAMVFAVIADQ
jgi:hypothetical protein